jgi:hypothetical protein
VCRADINVYVKMSLLYTGAVDSENNGVSGNEYCHAPDEVSSHSATVLLGVVSIQFDEQVYVYIHVFSKKSA